MDGYIKLHRKILSNPIVCKDPDHLAVWIYLLLNATHKGMEAVFNGKKIMLEPGELITGRKAISVNSKISESKVQRILKSFEIEHQIEQQTCNKNRLITIVNWEKYQVCEQQDEQQLNNKRTTTEQQSEHKQECNNKNDKNVKNDKKEIYKSFKDTYNEHCINLPSVRTLTEKRKKAVHTFLKEFTEEEFTEVCKAANKSGFLTGENDRGWRADFDFLIRPDKAASVLEGKYAGKEKNDEPKYKLECIEL